MKKKLSIVLAVVLTLTLLMTFVTSAVYGWTWPTPTWKTRENLLPMTHYDGCGTGIHDPYCGCCGPCSGVSIGRYYREIVNRRVEDFEWGEDEDDLSDSGGDMTWYTYCHSGCTAKIDDDEQHSGDKSARLHCTGADPSHYAEARYEEDPPNYKAFWLKRTDNTDIQMWGGNGEYRIFIRIPSYDWLRYYDGDWHDICLTPVGTWFLIELRNINWDDGKYDIFVDGVRKTTGTPMNVSTSHNGYFYYRARYNEGECWIDDISQREEPPVEDFEWGSDGNSLTVSGGELDWTVCTGGSSVAEIDDVQAYSGTRSARFYCDESNKIQGIYAEYYPTLRRFYLKKEADAIPYTITWYDGKRIYVRVRYDGLYDRVEYYDGYWVPTNACLSTGNWHYIEFRNIDWENGTYDIYVDETCYTEEDRADMDEDISYSGMTEYGSYVDEGYWEGEFWIDDIPVGSDYSTLPDDDLMYDVLYEEFPTFGCVTGPFYYGYGFLEMTIDPDQNNNTDDGYYNFGYVYDDDVTADDYWDIVDAIDNGWPIAISGWFHQVGYISKDDGSGDWPCPIEHYIAIRGYEYQEYGYDGGWIIDTKDHYIECTDSYSGSDELVLDWDEVVEEGIGLEINIIKDEIPEDFEWGPDGYPLSNDGENVDWTVTKDGSSVVEIDTYQPHSGSRCARFYYDGDPEGKNYVRGYYSEYLPIWRGFWLMTDGNAAPVTVTGDGDHAIVVRVTPDGTLQYYDGAWHNTNFELDPYDWYFIEFRAIKWDYPYKYSIYVDGNYVSGGRPMYIWNMYDGLTGYYSYYEGSFWIDDIPSSWW